MAATSMANHKHNIFEDTKEVILWRCVPCRVICKLIKRLNPVMTITGEDWRGLGDKLKYSILDIKFFESLNGVNAQILLDDYGSTPDASVNVIYQALKEMKRIDCLNILIEASDDIERAHRYSQDTRRHNPEDKSMGRRCGCFRQQACPCTSVPASACMSHTYPGPHDVHSCRVCGCRNPNHHNSLCYCHVHHSTCQMCWNMMYTPLHSAPCHSVPPVCEHSLRERYKCKYRATTTQLMHCSSHSEQSHQDNATAGDSFRDNQVLNRPSSGQTCCEQALRQSCMCNESADIGRDHRDINNNSSNSNDISNDNQKSLTSIRESLSIPQNIQSMAHNKALQYIKVFVTYSYSNRETSKQVLNLCRFIKSNGFTCNIDKILEDPREALEDLKKCKTMLANADIVLLCISDKYLEDIASPRSNSSSKTDPHQLHSREIYDILNSQRLNSQDNSHRDGVSSPHVISLMFPHLTHRRCPRWLMSGPVIAWPNQFKDLVKMIASKAEEVHNQDI